MKTFEKVLGSVTEKVAWVSQGAVVVCMAYVITDILRRSFAGRPLTGSVEVVEFIAAVILSLGIGYLTFVKGHVAVDVLVMRLRPQRQAIFDLVNAVISLGFAILLTLGLVKFGTYNRQDGAITGALGIPYHPFIYIVAASMALTCVVLIRDIVKAVIMLRTRGVT